MLIKGMEPGFDLSAYFSNYNKSEFLTTQILYEQAFTPDECNKIITISKKFPVIQANVGYGNLDYNQRKSKLTYINNSHETSWIDQRLKTIVSEANEKFFNLQLHSIAEVQFLEYNEGDFFNWHMDINRLKKFKGRKISISVFLSDPNDYEGGKLEWLPTIKVVPQEQGKIVLFPSFKYHRVTPVTKGTRYSLVAWARDTANFGDDS